MPLDMDPKCRILPFVNQSIGEKTRYKKGIAMHSVLALSQINASISTVVSIRKRLMFKQSSV